MTTLTISNLRLLAFVEATAQSRPSFYHKACKLIDRLGPAMAKDAIAVYPKFFGRVLKLCPDKRLAKVTLLRLASNHCPVCNATMPNPGRSGCSAACARNNPEVERNRLATYSETQKTKAVVNSKIIVSNSELLTYIKRYKEKFPNRFLKLVQALREQTRSYALPKTVKSLAPEFIAKGLDLVSGNSALFKKTVRTALDIALR